MKKDIIPQHSLQLFADAHRAVLEVEAELDKVTDHRDYITQSLLNQIDDGAEVLAGALELRIIPEYDGTRSLSVTKFEGDRGTG